MKTEMMNLKFQVANDVLWRWEGDNLIVNYIGDNLILTLDPISSAAWIKIAEQKKSFGEIVSELHEETGISIEKIKQPLQKLVSDFIKRKVLIQKEWNFYLGLSDKERGKLEKRDNVALSSPLIVDFIITWHCNLRCQHCLYECTPRRLQHVGLDNAFRLIDELAEMNVFTLSINGGEARLHPKFWEIMKYASDKNLHIVLTSNGTSFSKEDIKRLADYNMACVRFSLDSVYPEKHDRFRGKKGTFNKVIQRLKWIKEQTNIQTNILSTINKNNYDEIDDLIELAVSLNIDAINLFPMMPEGRASKIADQALSKEKYKEFLSKIYEIKQKEDRIKILTDSPLMITLFDDKEVSKDLRVCPAGIISCSVTVEGDLYPCPYFPKPVGNVFNTSFKDVWNNSQFLHQLRKEEFLGKDCKICRYNNTCRGGCRALSYTHYNTISKKDPFCWITQRK